MNEDLASAASLMAAAAAAEPPACSCCWSVETDAEGHVRGLKLVGWGGQETQQNYRLALHAICHLQKLQDLELCRYPLPALPVCMRFLSHCLQSLRIEGAEHIREFPAEIGCLSSLEDLTIKDCGSLQTFPIGITQLPNLRQLTMEECYEISAVPPEIGRLGGSLVRLIMRDFQILSLPPEIGQLVNLEYLELADFGVEFKLLPDELGDCAALEALYLELEHLKTLPTTLGKLQNLQELITHGCCYFESVPTEIKHCSNLQSLWLYDSDPDALVKFFSEPWDSDRYAGAPSFISLEKSLLGPAYKHILPGLPSSLVELNLGGNEIDSLDGLLENELPEGLRTLALQENSVVECDEEQENLAEILRRNRQLGCIDHKNYRDESHSSKIGRIVNKEIFHQLLMNQCGRLLLEINHVDNKVKRRPIPLSMWPTVLENVSGIVKGHLKGCRVEFDQTESAASVIYTMLQEGPALLDAYQDRRTAPAANRKRKAEDVLLLDAQDAVRRRPSFRMDGLPLYCFPVNQPIITHVLNGMTPKG